MSTRISGGHYADIRDGISAAAQEALDWVSALRILDEPEATEALRERAIATIEKILSIGNCPVPAT